MAKHVCTGPGCPGCYAEANLPYRDDPSRKRDPQTEEYMRREQEKWERGKR